MIDNFEAFGLRDELLQAVTTLGYEAPTSIQAQAIPILLAGKDMMGQAQTGTGKTAAFTLPMLHCMDADNTGVQGLVLAPTRELANQVARATYEYGQYCGDVRVLSIYGGQSYSRQIRRLRDGANIVVGTPGRMLDLIRKGILDLSQVRFLVLDEADEMLSMGFIEDIESILSETPETRQTALFSATLPKRIRMLADRYMNTPQAITVNPKQMTVAATEQRYYVVRESDKLAALRRLLEMDSVSSALIFTRTKLGAAGLADALYAQGVPADALHGDLSQPARETVMRRFRQSRISVLVATDVAARGLDIDDVSHVINYDLPLDVESYVHRIGRTGRAGKTGVAISLVTPQERWRVRKIERFTRKSIPQAKLPTPTQIFSQRDTLFLDKLADEYTAGGLERQQTLVAKLVESGIDPLDIAAAALRMARAKEQPVPEIVEIRDAPRSSRDRRFRGRDARGRAHARGRRGDAPGRSNSEPRRKRARRDKSGREAGMVRLLMDVGKTHNLRPAEIVGAIASTANIPGRAIGAIDIRGQQTYVDVSEKHAAVVLKKMSGWRLRGHIVRLQRAD